MRDCYQRRNRIAGLILDNTTTNALNALNHRPDPSRPVAMDIRAVLTTYAWIQAALAGETDPSKLGIDPLSLTALRLAALTSDPIEEPNLND
ncbi:Uncharacterised protein [Mycobacteroides abscessus subsp. abscessus]|nr:Uncharacterised protein [Mycobacteroides abscessus subsp. abscessus]